MNKLIKLIAGPNGSGKTTFAETFVINSKPAIPFLNPDIIAAGFGSVNPEKASFQAGRILLKDIKSKVQKGESFAFESTLSGLTYATLLNEAKNNNSTARPKLILNSQKFEKMSPIDKAKFKKNLLKVLCEKKSNDLKPSKELKKAIEMLPKIVKRKERVAKEKARIRENFDSVRDKIFGNK